MVIIKHLNNIKYYGPSVLTIGSLDGMHIGHCHILKYLKKISLAKNIPSIVVTFNQNPKAVLNGVDNSFYNLLPSEEKMKYLEQEGVDYVWLISIW